MSIIQVDASESYLTDLENSDDTIKLINIDVIKIYNNINNIPELTSELVNLIKKYDNHYYVHYCIGNFYTSINSVDKSIIAYEECLKLHKFLDASLNLAIIYYKRNELEKCFDYIDMCLNTSKTDIRPHILLTSMYQEKHKTVLTYNSYKNIFKNFKPNSLIYNNFALFCKEIGKIKKSNKYFNLVLKTPGCDKNIREIATQNKLGSYDYNYKLPKYINKEYLEINDVFNVRQKSEYVNDFIDQLKIKKKNNINIGFSSGDFKSHATMYFFLFLLNPEIMDNRFNIFIYFNVDIDDTITKYIKSINVIQCRNLLNIETVQAYNIIRSDKLDILIDLSGNTKLNRLDVFAMKPAPITMTWIGYPNTSGLINMDYKIMDEISFPKTTKQMFTEKPLYMPHCFLNYRPISNTIHELEIKINDKQNNKPFVFGVLNKQIKQTKENICLWNIILEKIPNSIIYIRSDTERVNNKETLYDKYFTVNRDRIKFVGKLETLDYYNMYNLLDCTLDTFPYNGTTTTFDSLWMGVPVITLTMPNRHCANVSASILSNLGYDNLIANTKEEFIEKACNITKDYSNIINFKKNLRNDIITKMDTRIYGKEFYDLIYNTYMDFKF